MARNASELGNAPCSSNFTCRYEFTVQDSGSTGEACWTGQGNGGAYFGQTEGLVGLQPRFELRAGWLTLFPGAGFSKSLPLFFFSGFEDKLDLPNETRELKAYAAHVGLALQNALRIGDTFGFSRNRAGDFSYRLARDSEDILRAGAADLRDEGGPAAIWQEFDRPPKPKTVGAVKPYLTVRMKDQVFHLADGQDAQVDSHYVFVARTTLNLSGIGFIPNQAVYAAGRLGELTRELIQDAALQLMKRESRIL